MPQHLVTTASSETNAVPVSNAMKLAGDVGLHTKISFTLGWQRLGYTVASHHRLQTEVRASYMSCDKEKTCGLHS